MRVYLQWIGAALLGVASLVVGLVPFIHAWPRWIFVLFGAGIVFYLFLTFPWRSSTRNQPAGSNNVRMTQTSGNRSRNIQSQGDVYVEGGMGDEK